MLWRGFAEPQHIVSSSPLSPFFSEWPDFLKSPVSIMELWTNTQRRREAHPPLFSELRDLATSKLHV